MTLRTLKSSELIEWGVQLHPYSIMNDNLIHSYPHVNNYNI